MNATISERWEPFVRSQVQSGRYASEQAVIDEVLRLLEQRDEQADLATLRHEIAIGIVQADRGELAPFDPHATLASIRSRPLIPTGQS